MNKIPVVLVIIKPGELNLVLSSLNFDKAHIVAVVIDGAKRIEEPKGRMLMLGDLQVPMIPFSLIDQVTAQGQNLIWLVCRSGLEGKIWKVAKFIENHGVPRDNIINFSARLNFQPVHAANLKYAQENPIDFFATGISITAYALDITRVAIEKNQDEKGGGCRAELISPVPVKI